MAFMARGRPPENVKEFWGDMFAYNIAMVPIIGPIISGKLMFDKWQNNAAPVYYEFLNGAGDFVAKLAKGELLEAGDTGIRLTAQATGFPNAVLRVFKESGGQEYTDQYGDFDARAFIRQGIMRIDE